MAILELWHRDIGISIGINIFTLCVFLLLLLFFLNRTFKSSTPHFSTITHDSTISLIDDIEKRFLEFLEALLH